jgi:hypothetical protein
MSLRDHIPISLATAFEDGLVEYKEDGEPEEPVPLCQHTNVGHSGLEFYATLSTGALRILRSISCLSACSTSRIMAHTQGFLGPRTD